MCPCANCDPTSHHEELDVPLVHPDRLTPCAGCPWIVGNQGRSQPCPGRHEAVASAFTGTQGFHTVMECHTLPDGQHGACIGYLLSDHGPDNFNVRLLAAGDPNIGRIGDGGHELHATYDAMAHALEAHWGYL
jgi:hypothetical protein